MTNRNSYSEDSSSSFKGKLKIGIIALIGAFAIAAIFGLFGKNDDQNWQVLQYPNGTVRIINTPGYYLKFWGSMTEYPRNWQVEYNSHNKDREGDWATKVTFNDGGWAHMDTIIRFSSPSEEPKQREFHRLFAGSEKNVEAAVWAHLSDAMKSSGPVMFTSEHQSARRSEYNALVQDQLEKGLFEMKKVEKQLLDQTDEKGKPITVYATEVVNRDGKIVVSNPSPLTGFGIKITQFSITDVRYDEQTVKQFVTKKEAFLAAENSKAQREKEVQERLMVEEKGKREKAEAEAAALKQKATEVINAQREKEVAELNATREKVVAETNSAKELAVAEMSKKQAEVTAQQQLEVARFARQTADEEAKAAILKANADKERLALAGAISEKDRVLAELEVQKAIGVARELSRVNVPSLVISGGGAGGQTNTKDDLMNLYLLKQLGVLKEDGKLVSPAVSAK